MYVLRVLLALVCFAIAIVEAFIPGPAILFWIIGFMLLGFSAGQILIFVRKVQAWLHERVPASRRLPHFRTSHMKAILRHRWIRALDRMTETDHAHRRRREARRARAARLRASRHGEVRHAR
jgi:hypothetical protein